MLRSHFVAQAGLQLVSPQRWDYSLHTWLLQCLLSTHLHSITFLLKYKRSHTTLSFKTETCPKVPNQFLQSLPVDCLVLMTSFLTYEF